VATAGDDAFTRDRIAQLTMDKISSI